MLEMYRELMKKCIIFFTLLILALLFAVLTDNNDSLALLDDVVYTENGVDNLLPEDHSHIAELCTE